MIAMSRLHLRLKTADTENDWVTMGVIVNKSDPRVSSKVNDLNPIVVVPPPLMWHFWWERSLLYETTFS